MVTIRDYAGGTDRDSLIACIVELQDHERRLDPAMPEGRAMADGYLEHLLRQCRECQGRILLAMSGDQVAGFVCILARVPPEPDESQHYAYISDLFVHARHRRQGLGRQLIQEAENFARAHGARVIRIGVLAANLEARHLYESSGFHEYHVLLAKPL